MRLVIWLSLIVLFSGWSQSGYAEGTQANACGVQLATRLGRKGATTLVLSPQGKLDTWTDGFKVEAGSRISNPFVRSTQLPTGGLNAITGLAAEILPDGSQTLLGVTESNGALSLVSPLGHGYPFLAPELGAVTGVAFRTSTDGKTISLYAGAGQRLYRLKMKWRDVDGDPDLEKLLMKGLVRVSTIKAMLPGERDRISFDTPALAAFDFSGGATYLLASLTPGRALEITDFEKVVTFKDENRMRQIDFISLLDDDRAVIGSKLGQTLIVDLDKKETQLSLNFPGLVLIDSLSAHCVGRRTQVWATDSVGQLYRWDSEAALTQFSRMVFGEGTSVRAKKVNTVSFTPPKGYVPGAEGREGFLSQVEVRGREAVVERVIVLGSDDNLYGYAEPATGIIQPGAAKVWLKVEKPAAAPGQLQ